MHSPSDVFGSLISDTEDFLDELNHRTGLDRNVYGSSASSPAFSPTPPFRTNSANRKPKLNVSGQFTNDEMTKLLKGNELIDKSVMSIPSTSTDQRIQITNAKAPDKM